MRLLARSGRSSLADRTVWQVASLLLAYPDERQGDRLDTAEGLLVHLHGRSAELLGRTLVALRGLDPLIAATDYVETFDMQRRSTMYLTYWTAGDTRNRGMEILKFSTAYRVAGVEPPRKEGPDYLPVVLEFAATVDPDVGRRLLVGHRVPLDVLLSTLRTADSVYAHVIAAVCETLPPVTDRQVQRAQQLIVSGPPAEAVGLQPYTSTGPHDVGEGG